MGTPRKKRTAKAAEPEASPEASPEARPELRVEYVPLPEVEGWPRNPKRHDEDGIADSIERFGFSDPVAVDERTGKLVEGHGRVDALRAMKEDGVEPPGRIRVDAAGEWLVPVLRGLSFRDDLEAEAYILAHNRLTERGGWDDEQLHAILVDLQEQSEAALRGTAFTAADIDRLAETLLAAAEADVDATPPAEFPAVDPDEGHDFRCPRCGYSWGGSPR